MDRVAPRAARDLDELADREIALARRRRPDRIRLIGETHVQRTAIDVAVHRDGADPELVARPDHAHGDLAAVRDEDRSQPLRQRSLLGRHSGMLPCLRFGFVSRFPASDRSAAIRRGRVSCGSITSSR